MTGGRGLSTSLAHDDLLTFLLRGGPRQNSIYAPMAVVPSSEVVTLVANTWLSKGLGHVL